MRMLFLFAIFAITNCLADTIVTSSTVPSEQVAPAPQQGQPTVIEEKNIVLKNNDTITLVVIGQGIAPQNAISYYQATALAKRAAIADAYRLLAEKLYGVRVEGYDLIKNMVIQKSQVKTCVSSIIRHSNIIETKCAKDFCEVEMELKVAGNKWFPELVASYK